MHGYYKLWIDIKYPLNCFTIDMHGYYKLFRIDIKCFTIDMPKLYLSIVYNRYAWLL